MKRFSIALLHLPGHWPTLRQVTGIDRDGTPLTRPLRALNPGAHLDCGESDMAVYEVDCGLFVGKEAAAAGQMKEVAFLAEGDTVEPIEPKQFEAQTQRLFPRDHQAADLYAQAIKIAETTEPVPPPLETAIGQIEINCTRSLIVDLAKSVADNADRVQTWWSATVAGETISGTSASELQKQVSKIAARKGRQRRRHATLLDQAEAHAQHSSLPRLQGSPRQVKWAMCLRDKLAATEPSDPRLVEQTSAKFWIDNRRTLNLAPQ